MATRRLKDMGSECWGVLEDDVLVARIVPHDIGYGWKLVDLQGKALNTRNFETPELALKHLPGGHQ